MTIAAHKQPTSQLHELRSVIENAASGLPAQGPITVFVHHNTLHAFEDMPFEKAVIKGSRIFGCQPYLSEDAYRQKLARGRIRLSDIAAVLRNDLGNHSDDAIHSLGTLFQLRFGMLQYPIRSASGVELRWLVAETDALNRFDNDAPDGTRARVIEETRHWVMRDLRNGRDQKQDSRDRRIHNLIAGLFERFGRATIEQWSALKWEAFCLQLLWRICHNGVHGIPSFAPSRKSPVRHRDLLFAATGEDSDLLVNGFLVRYCSAFLDQGFATWELPERDLGFYQSFIKLYGRGFPAPDAWLWNLKREVKRLQNAGIDPLQSIEESMVLLGVGDEEQEAFISETLLALRGWAGMIWQMETRGDRVAHPAPVGSLVEFLAVRLILERLALTRVSRDALGFVGSLCGLRKVAQASIPRRESVDVDQRAFVVFHLAQVLGWKIQNLYRLSKDDWSLLLKEIDAFSELERRRIYHLAFERSYRMQALDAVTLHDELRPHHKTPPSFQVVCCIDDREESFRRHLEEISPECETFGAAGFYGIAMYYKGLADAHFVPLCPIIIRPKHYVREETAITFADSHRRRTVTRRLWGTASQGVQIGSRTLLGGVLTGVLGALASFPLVARVLFPRLTAQIRRTFGSLMGPPPISQLFLERNKTDPGPEEDGLGYTLEEMASIVERQLRDIGLISGFARLVIMTGHGSSSVNNPHESAYNCGACAGGRGGPNARAFALMANDPRVRSLLTQRGLELPADVVFVGAYHNTCNDSMTYFDLDRLAPSHRTAFAEAKRVIDETRERNAHERCRRFDSAPLALSMEAALWHVENRAEDLAQTRPEYNHATNALCIVARRSRTRGLFLDRRAFLTSYDPTQDDEESTILTRILQAAIPVCAGISLEYYFSCVDADGWGCGTKLPHNVTSLLGVMLGAASDLQPGLSTQMIEIHEPLRLLFIVETSPDAMLQIMDRNDAIGRLCRNDWVQLAVLDPNSNTIHVFSKGTFQRYDPQSTDLPGVSVSVDWYRGWRGDLGFASVGRTNSAMHHESTSNGNEINTP